MNFARTICFLKLHCEKKIKIKKWWQWLDKINCVLFCLYSIIESLQFVPKHSAPKWKNDAFIFTCKLVGLYLKKNSRSDSKIFEHYAPLQKNRCWISFHKRIQWYLKEVLAIHILNNASWFALFSIFHFVFASLKLISHTI